MKKVIWIAIAIALASGAWFAFGRTIGKGGTPAVDYRTAPVERGEVIEGVAANGTVQPVVLVQVGTQVSGVIEKLFVDFNSKVSAGQVIALLDPRRLQSQVTQDEASIARATADLLRIRAAVTQSKAEADRVKAQGEQAVAEIGRVQALLTQAAKELERQQALAERRLTAPADVDAAIATRAAFEAQLASAQASVRQNQAQLAVARAQIEQSEAQVTVGEAALKQAQAQLASDKVNLDYATIASPVDGVVVSRNVDVGQTVAASLSAPTLFLIAQDLTKVQIQTSVPEADIGRVREGQRAPFTVDAHPDKSFDGIVSQVRLASTTVQNVVTYTVIVDAHNPDGQLFPGMTANVTFEIARSAQESLKVPASALRVKPADDLVVRDASAREEPGESEAHASTARAGKSGSASRGTVYVVTADNRLRAIQVKPGVSDGVFTMIELEDPSALSEGTEIVTAIMKQAEPTTTNPFAPPRMPGGGRGTR
ncbi:MAG: efflux RND transporter periplasmic adaptor subunit [Planctomycetota bacterium]